MSTAGTIILLVLLVPIIGILAWMVVAALFVVIANLVADILYGALDPRIRVGAHKRHRVRTRVTAHE